MADYRFTDEDFLHQYLHYYLRHMYPPDQDNRLANIFRNGFEEPLDPQYLCEAIYQLAERLGYKLVDNMWIMVDDTRPMIY